MAITIVNQGAVGVTPNNASAAMTATGMTLPASVVENDLLLMFAFFDTGTTTSGQTITNGSGWGTFLDTSSLGSGLMLRVLYKVAGASEGAPASPTFNGASTGTSTGGTAICFVKAYRGVDISNLPSSALAGSSGGNAFGTQQNIGVITGFTPTVDDALVIVMGGKKDDWTSVATLTGDGLTWTEDIDTFSTNSGDAGLVVNSAPIVGAPVAISSKTFTVTGGTTAPSIGRMFALNPAPPATPVIQQKTFRFRADDSQPLNSDFGTLIHSQNFEASAAWLNEAVGETIAQSSTWAADGTYSERHSGPAVGSTRLPRAYPTGIISGITAGKRYIGNLTCRPISGNGLRLEVDWRTSADAWVASAIGSTVSVGNVAVSTFDVTAPGTAAKFTPIATAPSSHLNAFDHYFDKFELWEGAPVADPAVGANKSAGLGEVVRVRFEIQETGGGAVATAYKLRYSKNSGAYTDVGSATDCQYAASAQITDGAATTNVMTGGTGTFVAGEGSEDALTASISLGASGHTEIEFVVRLGNTAAVSDTYDLRVYKSDGSPLDTYTVTPRITAISTSSLFSQVAFRFRDGDTAALNAAFTDSDPDLFEDGFESGGLVTGGWDSTVISGTGTIDVGTTRVKTGTYALHISKPRFDTAAYVRKTFTSTNSLFVEAEYYWDSDSGVTTTNGTGPRVFAGSNRIIDVLRQDGTNKQIALRYQSTDLVAANALFIQTGLTAELDTWTKIGMQVDYASGANSKVRVWVNDVLCIDESALTIYSGSYTAFQCGSEHTDQFLDLWIDDVVVDRSPVPIDDPPSGTNNLVSSGGRLRLASDNTLFSGAGLNVQTNGFSFGQTTFNAWYTGGVRLIRLAFWPRGIETGTNTYSQTELNHIHTSIQRANNAGIQVMICPLINSPVWGTNGAEALLRLPDHWLNNGAVNPTGPATPFGEFSTASHFDCLVSHGQNYITKIMTEFRDYANVIGFDGCNEPDSGNAGKVHRGIERLLGWYRAAENSTQKLYFLPTTIYSSQAADTTDEDWDAITDWTRCVLHYHCYFAPQGTGDDGYENDGRKLRDTNAGTFWNGATEASAYATSQANALNSHGLHFDNWQAFALAKGVPWGIGEAGVQRTKTTEAQRVAWAEHIRDAAIAADAAYFLGWIGADYLTQDLWSSNGNAQGASQFLRAEYDALMDFMPTEP